MLGGSLNYFFNALQLAPASWAVRYSFNSPSGSGLTVPSNPSGNSLYSGTLSSTLGNAYYSVSGSGLMSGNTIQINNASGLKSDYFTMFFAYEKPQAGNAILFSSLQSGANISGFIIGVNDANRIYFETYDQNGPNIITSQNIIGSKNAFAIVKANNVLNIHYYNFNYQQTESETFNTSSLALFSSNQAYVGGTGGVTPPYINQNNFTGYLTEFAYFNLSFSQNTVQKLFSGFYCTKNPSTTGVLGYSSGIGFITGGQVIYTGLGTGITGYQTFAAGTYVDFCGNPHAIYSWNNLTGIISGYKFFPLTGVFISTGTGLLDQGYNINTGFAASFGMDGVIYTRFFNSDFSEAYLYPSILVNNLNNLAKYNLDGTYKLNSISANNLFNLYDNGIAVFPSGFTTSGTVYFQTIVLQGDFYTSGQSIISTGSYQPADVIIYDYISGQNELFLYTGGNQTFASSAPVNRSIYWNGQKLISGVDYTFAGNNINITGLAGPGPIYNFPFQTGFAYNSGTFINLFKPRFARGASQLWMNGQRQQIDVDYLEISNIDLLSGSGIFVNYPTTLYNNNGRFILPF